MAKQTTEEVTLDRRTPESVETRRQADRRQADVAVSDERRQGDRRKVQRRRQIDPTTCERDYTNDEIEFMQALDAYKRSSGRMFPTCSEILEVIRDLGYLRPGDFVIVDEEMDEDQEQSDETELADAELDSVDP